jgi:Fe2+ or Zn2+ uptake regulation protein
MTPQRWVILEILQRAGGHLSPVEIYRQAGQALPGLTEATVYRNLSFLAQQGLVLAAHIGSGQLVYETAGHDHHHLICRTCGATLEIDHSLLVDLYAILKERTGYKVDSVHTTFFGACPACQAASDHSSNKPIV